jgi:diguanylate cyclase (GGDEF)-like protein
MNIKPSSHLEALRPQVAKQLASLLESQTRSQVCVANLTQLINNVHREITEHLKTSLDEDFSPAARAAIRKTAADCARLDECLELLFSERVRQWQLDKQHLQTLMLEFSATLDDLAETLIEKNLFERQNQALQRIVLSHERIMQWKEFVQEILSDFHETFPFKFFFIAFAETNVLSLSAFYSGAYAEDFRARTRNMLAERVIAELRLANGIPLVYDEFVLAGKNAGISADVQLLTAAMPEQASKLKGLLGMAFDAEEGITSQEETVIRSILAVLVMVIGSSKVLSNTLRELEYNTMHDPLTGLYNRRHFNAMLEQALNRPDFHRQFSLLLLDIDNFKDVNDTYGHLVGDQALCSLSEILHAQIRRGDFAARLGGDEFAVILTDSGPSGALRVAQNIGAALRESFLTVSGGKQFYLTASIGVVTYPHDARSVRELLSGADSAMYSAKKLGKDTVCNLDAAGGSVAPKQSGHDKAEYLRAALRENRFLLYFQPIIDCRTGAVFAYEALARLREHSGEIISAGAFIETIERYGLAREFDRFVVDKAMIAKQTCLGSGCSLAQTKMFINLSAQEIESRGILGYAEELCERLGVSSESVVFEITERDAISDMYRMRNFINRLRGKGFGFALDDFGSGYNSFNYLRELRFDYAKIDGAFVRNILNSSIDYTLVRNLFNLCRDMDIGIVAEYVENRDILDALRNIGVDYAQGFHIGLPHPRMDCLLYYPPEWKTDYSGYKCCPLGGLN